MSESAVESIEPSMSRSGSTASRPALLLHGFAGSSRSWGEAVLGGLSRAGIATAPMDLPGHGVNAGEVDPAGFTLEATFERITERAAAAPSGIDLVGYSMGGRLALHYALGGPTRIRRLVLESASPGLESERARARRRADDDALAQRIVAEGVEAFVDRWEALPLFDSRRRLAAELRAAHRRRRLANDARSLAAALRGLGTGALPSLWGRLGGRDVPTLIVVGALDVKFVEIGRRMERAMPNARLAVVADAGHTVHLERPDAWLREVTDFIGE